MPNETQKNMKDKKDARIGKIQRDTTETQVEVMLNLDGTGITDISTNIGFLDHMLVLLGRHAEIDLNVKADGDLDHHITEDVAICIGTALLEALGDKKGIRRYGDKTIPMDECLATCALDLGGRAYHHIDMKLGKGTIEDSQAEDLEHFFETLSINAKINLHINVHYGMNEHHKVEASFKAFAHALKEAKTIVGNKIPSTKGVI